MRGLLFCGLVLCLTSASANAQWVPPDITAHRPGRAAEFLCQQNIMLGYPDGKFKGDQNATRYELAQILSNLEAAVSGYAPGSDTSDFGLAADVPPDHWARPALQFAIGTGLMGGFPDGTFRGDQNLSRYELAQTLSNLHMAIFRYTAPSERPELHFTADIPPEHWARPAVQEVTSVGWMVGYPDGTFRGHRFVTRYELAQIISNLCDSLGGLPSPYDSSEQ